MILQFETQTKRQILDITDDISELLDKDVHNSGIINIFVPHTTATVTLAETDPETLEDYLDAFDALIPKLNYRHRHDPPHVVDHILASIIGPSINIPFEDGELLLGTWQDVVLVELDGPRTRNVYITIINNQNG